MAGTLLLHAQMLVWLLLARGVRLLPLDSDLQTMSEMASAGTDDAELPSATERPTISISAVDLYAEDYGTGANRHPFLFHLLQPSKPINTETSVQELIERLKKTAIVNLNLRKVSNESAEETSCGNDSSTCQFMETVKRRVPEISETPVKPLSAFTICAIIVSVLIIVVAAVWYAGKHYMVRYWNTMQLLLHGETIEVVERRQNNHEMISRPINLSC
ncbi:uncharacterized protein LOC126299168 [Schistocerca gregaria]|uniref:uncharacterized protein LOC126299168 n=1 Tax=Schistocerca gregaria TaxID=7010 RepID=UPI00211E404D|nr:uncharacterized protein LOC126299168 [Schistocerca gregaria]